MRKITIPFSLLLLSLFTSPAHAIECQGARSTVEKQICSNTNLLKLDSALNSQYETVIESADNPEKVRREQIEWLKQVRARCDSDACLELVYQERKAMLEATPKFRWVLYSDKAIGIEFSYPSNRKVVRTGNDLYVSGFRMPEGHSYIIHFHVGAGDFNSANKEASLFEERDGKWFAAIGRFQNPVAEAVSGVGWKGLRTTIGCGISDKETGFHAAGGECFWALVSDGKHYVLADTSGILGLDDDTRKSFMSLKFLPRQ